MTESQEAQGTGAVLSTSSFSETPWTDRAAFNSFVHKMQRSSNCSEYQQLEKRGCSHSTGRIQND